MGEGRAAVIAESDVVTMARAVRDQVKVFEEDRPRWDRERAIAREFIANQYSAEARDRAALTAFRQIAAPGSNAVIPHPVRVRHFSSYEVRGPIRVANYRLRTHLGRIKRRLQGRS